MLKESFCHPSIAYMAKLNLFGELLFPEIESGVVDIFSSCGFILSAAQGSLGLAEIIIAKIIK